MSRHWLGRNNQHRPPPGGRAPIAGLIRHDAEQPGPEGRAGAEAGQGVVGLDERLLRRILGLR
uniref:hypothetical protein n=1 Tax=Gordonia sp. (in: high G+C Gram-positive bacteria) TaxID=84139 RepID=UPI002C28F523